MNTYNDYFSADNIKFIIAMSPKQVAYLNKMLKQIGYVDENVISTYIDALEKEYGENIPYDKVNDKIIWKYSISKCFEILIDEIDLKSNKEIKIEKIDFNKNITATDLSQFTFCPISFVISKSFKTDTPKSALIGTEYHNMGLLSKKVNLVQKARTENNIYNLFGDEVIKLIYNSTLIFSGHWDEQHKIFINDDFSGCPDYIFQDDDGKFFIVEEKFHKGIDPIKEYYKFENQLHWDAYNNDLNSSPPNSKNEAAQRHEESALKRERDIKRLEDEWHLCLSKLDLYQGYFHGNHILQLISYLKNINEYRVEYGYLVYWYYDYDENGNRYLFKSKSKQIELNEERNKQYDNIKNKIKTLLSNKEIQLDYNFNPKVAKCIKCVVSKYCGHKSGRYRDLKIPYSVEYLKLYYTGVLPDINKKS